MRRYSCRARTLQSLDTIEQLWQLANHDLLAKLVAMIVRRVSRDGHAVGDVAPDARIGPRSSRREPTVTCPLKPDLARRP